MPRENRNQVAKTGVKLSEKRLIAEVAEELGLLPSEVIYIAIVRFLREERPEDCEAAGIRSPMLVA